jgi:tRNA A37 threonylcarbamoyladenosine dehydratase
MKQNKAIVRIASPESARLWNVIFKRYPDKEWGTFVRFGWVETRHGFVLTLKGVDEPAENDLNEANWMTEITSQYIRKVLRSTSTQAFATGFVHSHPEGYGTQPSELDDDMEVYCSDLLKGYHDRPFVSLIFSKAGERLSASGRVYWKGQCFAIDRFAIENCNVSLYNFEPPKYLSADALKKIARLASAFSEEAAQLLAGAVVGVVGQSGTGSPVDELLCRAGVGKIIGVDEDIFTDSNLERVHGSEFDDAERRMKKVLIAKRHLQSINPHCVFVAIDGRLPQEEVLNELLWCDIVVGCTDQHSARVALSELSFRYLVPVIDIGVNMEGKDGKVTGQVVQINKLFPGEPCVYCRGMIDSQIASQELMTEAELADRRAEAKIAQKENKNPNAYWKDMPQLNTVGYLTTWAGSLATGYVIGYLTGRFAMAKNRLELNIGAKGIQVIEKNEKATASCGCVTSTGSAGQQLHTIISVAPGHWPKPVIHS